MNKEQVKSLLTSRFDKDQLAADLNKDADRFSIFLELCTTNNQPYGWRSAWVLKHALKKEDPRLYPHVDQIIAAIPDVEDGHQRELMLMLEKITLNDDQEGLVFDISVTLWESVNKPPSVRMQGLKFILRTVEKYPELKNEIDYLLEERYAENLPPGMMRMYERITNFLR